MLGGYLCVIFPSSRYIYSYFEYNITGRFGVQEVLAFVHSLGLPDILGVIGELAAYRFGLAVSCGCFYCGFCVISVSIDVQESGFALFCVTLLVLVVAVYAHCLSVYIRGDPPECYVAGVLSSCLFFRLNHSC